MASNATTSSSANAVPQVARVVLTGTNYASWSIWMKRKLSREGLWDVVESSTKKLNDDAWRKKNAAALRTIQYWCVSDIWSSISSSDNISSAKDAWDELVKKYRVVNSAIEGSESHSIAIEPMSSGLMVKQSAAPNYGFRFTCGRKKNKAENIIPEGIVENPSRSDILTLFKAIYGISPFPSTAKLASYKTVLCDATSKGHTQIVEVLVKNMSVKDLQVTDETGYMAMNYAASYGYTQIAKCLYEKNNNLVTNVNGKRVAHCPIALPVVMACNAGYIDTTRYLYSVTPMRSLLSDNGIHGSELLSNCLVHNMFDIALHLIRKNPELALALDRRNGIPILALATVPSLFLSGSKLSLWEGWIYSCLKVKQSAAPNEDFSYTSAPKKSKGENIIPKVIKQIYNLKKSHANAHEFLVEVCEYTSYMIDDTKLIQDRVRYAVFEAAKQGIIEPIIEIFKANPDLITLTDEDRRNIFMIATIYRQEKVFSLIYGFDTGKTELLVSVDRHNNSLLHLAANLGHEAEAKLTQISGAALQMQRELQWFKEMENILPQVHKKYVNKGKKTAKQVFDRTHRRLAKEGQEWMKQIASSSTVVGTLIMTIMFTAAFTVPGGNDQNVGFPIFLTSGHGQFYENAIMVFIISDAISLFTSSTSVLMFLGILTSRYAMEDFLKSLPNKLIIALSTLFISIAAMMIAFCAGLMIMLERRRSWITIPISLLATIPIILFARLQFPLLVKIFISTYGAGIFDRKMKLWT